MKVLISSRSFGKIDSGAIELLEKQGLTPILNPYGRKLDEKEILNLIDDSVGIIAGTEKITDKIISRNNQLKVISRYGIGIDNIDIKAAEKKDIMIFNTPDSPSIAVAELTISLILNLLKKIGKSDRDIRNDIWKPEIGNLLSKKTVGIIGLGRIGKKLIQFLLPFNTKIFVYDINPDIKFIAEHNLNLTSLSELISQSDIITLHIPLTKKTKHMIGKSELNSMKPNAILINAARGGLVDEKSLYFALKNNIISGAAIDVLEDEPKTGSLKELDNIIITPHIGTFTEETRINMEIEAAENLINGLKKMKIL